MSTTYTTQKQVKYRPSLTATQITHILALAKKDMLSPHSVSVVSTLAPFQAKIEASAITPAYTTTPATSTLEKLGGMIGTYETAGHVYDPNAQHPATQAVLESTVGDTREVPANACIPEANREAYWETCYHKYLDYPEHCSLGELQAAKEHMYLNELMSPEETAAFERGEI